MKNITGNYESNLGNQIEIWKGNGGHLINIIKKNETIGPFDIVGTHIDKNDNRVLKLAQHLEIIIKSNGVIELKDKGISELFSKI